MLRLPDSQCNNCKIHRVTPLHYNAGMLSSTFRGKYVTCISSNQTNEDTCHGRMYFIDQGEGGKTSPQGKTQFALMVLGSGDIAVKVIG